MHPIELYFRAEKAESLVFVGAGVVAVTLAAWLLLGQRTALSTGLAIPLLLIGLTQLTVGGSVYLRTDRQQAELEAVYARAPAQFAAQEMPRMQQVNASFDLYKLVEIAFILIGTGLIYFRQQHDFWLGLGLGMLLQGTVMLAADIFAERRADVYTAFVARQG
ncbi:hypothetical protein GCM10023185_09690 [Hymenobacter saemangeumensis]|uniref:Uncharacterized protein n=1 Tax=Hymenobacter saemangeumensis TaxID=1084522 RepID=A0ABP8I521_9BACT